MNGSGMADTQSMLSSVYAAKVQRLKSNILTSARAFPGDQTVKTGANSRCVQRL